MVRFANIYFSGVKLNNSNMLQVNIGDNLQFKAIDYLFNRAGISSKDVIRIKLSEMKRGYENKFYKDDFLIIPMNWSMWEKQYMDGLNLSISDHIRVIPLGMCIAGYDNQLFYNENNINYYKSIAPLGCRDEFSMKKMQSYGISAYLNGCLTSLFPRLEHGYNEQGRVFFIDAPEELRAFVPKSCLKNAVFMSQQYYFSSEMSYEEINERVKLHYNKIKTEARLVVTSRLHVASPCLAWGIPVIFAKKIIDHRFGWLDKYIPLYSERNYSCIDWNPLPVDYEESKQKLLNFNLKRITDTYDLYRNMDKITEYYGTLTSRNEYPSFRDTVAYDNQSVFTWLSNHFSPRDNFSYALWGITDATEKVYNMIQQTYPYAKLVAAVDRFKETYFHGIKITKPETLHAFSNAIVIVLPVKASSEAKNLFRSLKWDTNRYFLRGDLFMES